VSFKLGVYFFRLAVGNYLFPQIGTGKFISSDGHREIIYSLRWAQGNYLFPQMGTGKL
jgi:hypothetical protein